MLSVLIHADCYKQTLYAEFRYVECRYAECRGTMLLTMATLSNNNFKKLLNKRFINNFLISKTF